MSFPIKVTCECGFESNVASIGMVNSRPCTYQVPVFLQGPGELTEFLFHEAEIGLKDEALVDWVQEHGDEQIRRSLGDDVIVYGSWPDGGPAPPIRCPQCRQAKAQFVDAGF
jgi:hypothetical protein